MKILLLIISLIIAAIISSCSLLEAKRNYTVSVLNNDKQAVLSIVVKYHGKSPYGNEVIEHNWQSVDTDFYQVSFENLTDSIIYIEEISYAINKGPLYTAKVKGKQDIKGMYGTTQINPNETLRRDNAWVWARKDNTLHRLFVFNYNNERIEVDIPLVYRQ